MMMNRTQILGVLADCRQEIAARYGVKRLALFGSAARHVPEEARTRALEKL